MTLSDDDQDRRPRYLLVRDRLVERIQSGRWAPGQLIPSEFEIAHEFGVSQGTARMAVAALASENVVVRRQGLGTFVYEHTPDEEVTRFFCLFDANCSRIDAEGRTGRPVRASASQVERRELKLPAGGKVLRIARTRSRNGTPFVLERISLPEAQFRGLAARQRLPDTLYELYQKSYGIFVVRAEERITAVVAEGRVARTLRVASGTPLLRIERVALALKDRPVEWRVSLCHLANAHYFARLK